MRELDNFRPRSKSFGVMPIHKHLMKQEKNMDDDLSSYSVNCLAPATATVAPLIPAKIDTSQAYSQGMSRRKLFMIQQMRDAPDDSIDDSDLKETDDSDLTSNPSNYAAKQSDVQSESSSTKVSYECHHCDIVFRDCVMYTMHMGYHGFHDALKCNMCGYLSSDKVDFFLHIARVAHA